MHVSSIQISKDVQRTVCSLRGPLPVQGHQPPAASISNSPQAATFVSQAKRRNASGSFRFSSSRKQLAAGRCVSCYQLHTWIGSKRRETFVCSIQRRSSVVCSIPSVPRRHTLFESIQRRSEAYIICARNMGCPCPFRACLRQHNWHAHRCTCFIQRKEPLLTRRLKCQTCRTVSCLLFT